MSRTDEHLGRALRALDVPDHAEGFFETLEQAMREHDRTPAQEQEHAMTTRSKTHGGSRTRWARVLVPVAVVAALTALAAGPLRSVLPDGLDDVIGPSIATAAEVQARAVKAVADAEGLSGTLVIMDTGTGDTVTESRYEFLVTARGDMRLSGTTRLADGAEATDARAYDSSTRTETGYSLYPEDSGGRFGWTRSGLAPGLPDQSASDLVGAGFGDIVLSLAQAQDPAVHEETFEGRDVWVLSADVEPNMLADGSPDHIEITVDQDTGFPVRVVRMADGSVVQETRLENLRIDPVIPAEAFTLAIPDDVEHYESDAGFRTATIDDASEVVGYAPLLPSWLPDGFELIDLAVAREAGPTGTEGGNPTSEGVVSASYGRGFRTLLVTTRLVGEDPSAWSDPLSLGEGYIDRPETVTIEGGAFDGVTAELLMDPRGIPHLWAMNGTHVLTVSGSLTREELLRVAGAMGR